MRKISISAFSILVALLPIITLASYKASSVSAYTYQDPFHSNSIWNAPIPSNAAVASNSAQMIQQIRNEYGGTNLPWTIAGVEQPWSVPVYYADANTPRVRVCGSDGNYCTNNVPIAPNFYPSPDSDAKIVIIETNANPQRAWSFWSFHAGSVNGSQYIADYGAYGWSDITDNGDGLTLNDGGQWGGRASGANYIGGLIDPEEIQSGVIDHALAISFTGGAVSENIRWWPARGGDGYSTNANAVPYGARIQLDPSFDINTVPTTNGARAIARALQTYGAWVMDTGGSFALYAREYVNSNGTINRTPWNGLINASEIESYIPWTSLRVLTQQNANDFYPINSGNPVLTSVTPVPTYTNDTTPNFTFHSTQAGAITYGGTCLSATTTAVSGNNTVTFNVLAQGTYSNCTVRVTNSAGGQSNIIYVNIFTIDTTAPVISSSATIPDGYNQTPPYSFNSNEVGYTVWGGICSTTDSNVVNGVNNKTLNFIPRGTYSNCTLRVQDRAGNLSNQININSFTINGWDAWALNQGSTISPLTAISFNNRIYNFVVGDSTRIYLRSTADGTFDNSESREFWTSELATGGPGGNTRKEITAAVHDNQLYIAVLGSDTGYIYTNTMINDAYPMQWSGWYRNTQDLGSGIDSVAMTSFYNGVDTRLYQFVAGQSKNLFYRSSVDGIFDTQSEYRWSIFSGSSRGSTPLAPAVAVLQNQLFINVVGDSGRVFVSRTSDGMFDGGVNENFIESSPGAETNLTVSLASDGVTLYQAVKGISNKIYTRSSSDGVNWSAWSGVYGDTLKRIGMVSHNNRIYQYAIGFSGNIYSRNYTIP